jgi:hypothetical protein
LGIALRRVDAATSADLTVAFAAIEESSSEALLVQSDPMLEGTEFPRILEFAVAHRLPTVIEAYPTSVPLGVLLSHGPQLLENARLAPGSAIDNAEHEILVGAYGLTTARASSRRWSAPRDVASMFG